ncbi:hypothetical protein [Salipiger mucosus]|uniref:Uncharacterized protein n=1 Tax=Salipiger mucosus DSM 16094 TaxID=1123237 RepID=S9S3M1_9RHOB|nr:hypothetical protein [Salipiger mucosus]EPX84795.1 hypothetical protein Salmuc_01368 [Salipiger mucosus DSM 16094]
MPLFACQNCNAIENTAVGWYWCAKSFEDAICSECRTGTWHGHFPKQDADGWVPEERAIHPRHLPPFLTKPEEGS